MTPLVGASTRVSRHGRTRCPQARLGGGDASARGCHRLLCHLEVALGIAPALKSSCVLLEIPLSGRQLRLRRDAVGLGAGLAALLLARLEARENLTASHALSLSHIHTDQVTLEPRAHLDTSRSDADRR